MAAARAIGATLALIVGAALLASKPAYAQDLSNKPIRLIVGLSAGGGTDVMARIVSQKMSENLRTTVFVETKAGGASSPARRPTATRCSSSRPAC